MSGREGRIYGASGAKTVASCQSQSPAAAIRRHVDQKLQVELAEVMLVATPAIRITDIAAHNEPLTLTQTSGEYDATLSI